jgi:hypothetical protein
MDTTRHIRLLEAGDLGAWPALSREVERGCVVEQGLRALQALYIHGHYAEAATQPLFVVTALGLAALKG